MFRTFAFVIFASMCCFVGLVYSQEKYGCQKNECAKYKCHVKEKCYGRLIENGSLPCGCCDLCVEYLELGEECQEEFRGNLPRKECGEGLMCDKSNPNKLVCKYANTKCIQEQFEFTRELKGTDGYTMGKPKPRCDTFGDYEPVQCKEGMKCYCVDIDGQRIFGLAPYSEGPSMNCTCSRDHEAFKRYMKDPEQPNQFMRCAPNGDYFHTQCTEDKCYCVDPAGVLTKQLSNKNDIAKIMCSDDIIDDFNTPCIREYIETMKQIEEFPGLVLGIEPPTCDLDGSYAPVQCKGFACYCVNKEGRKATQTKTVVRNSQEARTMTCGCLREKVLLKDAQKSLISDMLTQYKCMNNGNYLPVQCTTAVCFCVNEIEGFQIGPPNLISNRQNLPCYRSEYENILNIIFD